MANDSSLKVLRVSQAVKITGIFSTRLTSEWFYSIIASHDFKVTLESKFLLLGENNKNQTTAESIK